MASAAHRPLRFWDLTLYAVAMGFSIRWVAAAAAAGPVSIVLWVLAMVGFMGPLVLATAELTSRFPGDGGIYAWTGRTLGPFAGFLCGWLYWASNLPFFSTLTYFIINVLGVVAGPRAEGMLKDPTVFASLAIVLILIVAGLHLLGLGVGKWLTNLGAAASFGLVVVVIGAGAILAVRDGPATDFAHASYALPINADGAAMWATMVFAFGGPEALAFLKGDVDGGTRQILRVLAVAAVAVIAAYVGGTLGMLSVLRPDEASRLSGVPDALRLALTRLDLASLSPAALILLAAGTLGSLSAWFGVAARLPFVIGVDRYLPAAFGHRDRRTGAPVVSILVQTAVVIALIILSQAGETVKAAYDFLISMSVLSYTIPFAVLFMVFLIVQGRPAPAGEWTAPGGPPMGRLIGTVGLAVTLTAIACTLVPSPEAADKIAALVKLVVASAALIAWGGLIYLIASLRRPVIAPAGTGGAASG